MTTGDEWDPAAQDGIDATLRGLSPEERADVIRESCMSEAEVQAWANSKQRRSK